MAPGPPQPGTPPSLAAFQRDFASRLARGLGGLLHVDVEVRPAGAGPADAASPAGGVWRLAEIASGARTADAGAEPVGADAPGRETAGRPGDRTAVELELSAEAAYGLFERLAGSGGGLPYVPDRPLTDIERSLLGPAANVAGTALHDAWPDGAPPLALAEAAEEAGTFSGQRASDAEPDASGRKKCLRPASGLRAAFKLSFGAIRGLLWLRLPGRVFASTGADGRQPVELSAELGETTLPREDVERLEVGDLLATGRSTREPVTVRVAGIPRFVGRLGKHNAHRAVTILKRLGSKGSGTIPGRPGSADASERG